VPRLRCHLALLLRILRAGLGLYNLGLLLNEVQL
jgi:hypothetical protein